MTKEALRLALEALEIEEAQTHYPPQWLLKAITAIKEALAQPDATMQSLKDLKRSVCDAVGEKALAQPEQEPVADYCHECVTYNGHHEGCSHFTTPPQRTWVGLTDEEMQAVVDAQRLVSSINVYFKAIEAKLKEKNTP